MDFQQQIKWLDDKITQLEVKKDKDTDYFARMKSRIAREAQVVIIENLEMDIDSLKNIRNGYKKAHADSIKLSWTEYPEGMGK